MISSDNSIGLDVSELDIDTDPVLTAGRSFSRFEAGLAVSYKLTDNFSIGANASTTYAGENVGADESYGLSVLATW